MDKVDMQTPVSGLVMEVGAHFALRDSILIVYGFVRLTENAFKHRKVICC